MENNTQHTYVNSPGKNAWIAVLSYCLSIALLLFGLGFLGFLDQDKIMVTGLATTGPQYEVVAGRFKLKAQIPDTILHSDVSGIMVYGEYPNDLDYDMNSNYDPTDYFVITIAVAGVKQSDSFSFHPLVKIIASRPVNYFTFWILVMTECAFVLIFLIHYRKYKVRASRACSTYKPSLLQE